MVKCCFGQLPKVFLLRDSRCADFPANSSASLPELYLGRHIHRIPRLETSGNLWNISYKHSKPQAFKRWSQDFAIRALLSCWNILQTYSSYSVWWLVMGISRCFKAKKLWPSNRSITIPIFNQSDHRPTFNIPNFHRLCQGLGRWFCPPIIGNSQGQTVSCGVWSHDIPIKLIKTMIIWWLNPIKSPWSLKWYTQWYQPFF